MSKKEDSLRKKEFEEAKELFEIVFNNSAAAIIVTDKEDLLTTWNPFAEKMLGMSKEDLFNKPAKDLFSPEEWQRLHSLPKQKEAMVPEVETQMLKKDGSILDVGMSFSFIRETGGEVTGSIRIMHDMTRQKADERKIKESENKIRIILDNSAAVITLTDEQERIVSWNRYTEQLLGMKKDDLYLKHVSCFYPKEEWEKIRRANIRKSGSKHHIETKIVRKDGKIIDVNLSINVLKDEKNKIVGSVGIMQDITRQKRVHQMLLQAKISAEEASSAKSLFLANMSHEVRTPMNTIMGMVDLTLDTDLTEEQRDNLETVKNAADILLSLLNDILDLSRVEAGKIELEDIEFNIHNIVKSVCKGLSVLARDKGLELVWDIESQVQETLIGDPVRIRQVLVNLINNSIKFTFKGKVMTTVKVNSLDKEICELQFAVTDEGVGIPQDKLKTIFEDFTQVDASTTRQFGGTGLGLSISLRLVEMMQGRIWVESEELQGSTFSFTAKFKVPQEVKKAKSEAGKSTGEPSAGALSGQGANDLKQLSILLAEDNIVNQKIAVRMLEKRGWTVKTADNGKQVLDHLAKESFDLILMDAQMPVLDGFETTEAIRRSEAGTGKHIPIIALTARAMTVDRKKCLDSGMDGYVSKPIDRQRLYETIENFIQKRSVA